MRAITKALEPASLAMHRQTAHCYYSNYTKKDELREALVREQRGLCCYCLARIAADSSSMKIEHWRCQSRNPERELVYRNLLGACMGGHGQPEHLQHCDTRKGESDLKWNPAEPGHHIEHRIYFEPNGTIASSDADFNAQLNEVLGLNLPLLKKRREGVLKAILDWWKAEKARLQGPVPRKRFEHERARRVGVGYDTLAPLEPVTVWWLDERIARLTP